MSLFIGQLAFAGAPSLFEQARLGTMLASLISAILGLGWLYFGARGASADG
jgi:NhaA family Na+:H+ antiporter